MHQRRDIEQLKEIAERLDDGSKRAIRRRAEIALLKAKFFSRTMNNSALVEVAETAVHLAA